MYPSELGQPKRTIIFTASGAITPNTNGAEQAKTDGNFSYYTLNFDQTTGESAYWEFVVPDSFDIATNCNVYVHWTTSAGSTDSVSWKIATLGRMNEQWLDVAVTGEIEIVDTVSMTNNLMISDVGSLSDDWNPGEYAVLKVRRDPDDASDDLAADAKLLQVKIEYDVTQESD
jgi:hypothetical protein